MNRLTVHAQLFVETGAEYDSVNSGTFNPDNHSGNLITVRRKEKRGKEGRTQRGRVKEIDSSTEKKKQNGDKSEREKEKEK